ncbi:hypothetical protein [Synechocystis salina]|uniref:hypothetical protein n=1 Tax=Synechocystis salina TaxID=945780 RepID=UPI001D14C191|nr:hypothetical protein [Synechocystis salina]
MGRAHYQAGFSISPLAIAVNVNLVRQRAKAPSPQPWQWIYTFSDGSQLQGTFQGTVKPGPEFANPIPSFDVQGVGVTEYLTAADKTPLLAWQPGQFNCFEMGESLLLMASSDNYVAIVSAWLTVPSGNGPKLPIGAVGWWRNPYCGSG